MSNAIEALKKKGADLDALLERDSKARDEGTLKADDAEATRKAVESYVNEAQDLIRAAEAADDAGKAMAEIRDALKDAGSKPADDKSKGVEARLNRLESYSGVVNPRGMTLGEAVISSEAYKGFDGLLSADGGLRVGARIEGSMKVNGGLRSTFEKTDKGEFVSQKDLSQVSTDARGRTTLDVDPYNPQSASGLQLRSVCNYQTGEGSTFEYVRMTYTNNAAFTADATSNADIGGGAGEVTAVVGGLKPESDVQYTAEEDTYRTLPHLVTLHRNHIADRPRLMGEVNQFLRDSLPIVENAEILTGTGAPGLDGLMNNTDIPTLTPVGTPTDLDLVLQGVAAIWNTGRRPNALVVSPDDWFTDGFVLAKDANGNYLFGGPTAGYDALQGIWGMRVFVDTSMTAGSAILGDFNGATFVDRQAATVHMTDSHKDYFARNLVAVLIEERVGFAVTDAQRFIKIGGL